MSEEGILHEQTLAQGFVHPHFYDVGMRDKYWGIRYTPGDFIHVDIYEPIICDVVMEKLNNHGVDHVFWQSSSDDLKEPRWLELWGLKPGMLTQEQQDDVIAEIEMRAKLILEDPAMRKFYGME